MNRNRACLVIASMLFVACNEDFVQMPDPLPATATRVISAKELADAPEIPVRESLRLGRDELKGNYTLVRPVGVIPALNGDIYVLDAGNRNVIEFDRNGQFIRVFGKRGNGPGEFRSAILDLALANDTVFVLERVLHAFSLDGSLIYSKNIEPPHAFQNAVDDFVFTDRNLMIRRTFRIRDRAGQREPQLDTFVVQTRSATTGMLDAGLRLLGPEWFVRGKGIRFLRAFGGKPEMAIAPSGRIIYSRGNGYIVDVLSGNGQLLDRIRGDAPRIPITKVEHQQALRSAKQADERRLKADPKTSSNIAKFYKTIPKAEFRSMIGRILAGDADLILVERVDLAPMAHDQRTESHWDAIQLPGQLVGRVTLPAGFLPLSFRLGQLFGVELTEMDAPMVVRYDINKH